MENRVSSIEKLMESPLGLDDSFSFRCRQCGKCCRDREDILLSPFDICRIAKHLRKEPFEVIKEYGNIFIGHTSKIPLVSLKMHKDSGACPFLRSDHCSIQKSKPTVCALYPLGRFAATDEDSGVTAVSYILQPVGCGSKDDSHTPREWLREFDLEESEEWFLVWQDTAISLMKRIETILPTLTGMALDQLYSGLLEILYMRYRLEEPLLPQVLDNKETAHRLLDIIDETLCQYLN